jgi:steroid Delta-isomerase
MTAAGSSEKVVTDTVRRYVDLLSSGSADDIVDLFAENATVEDPVGGEVRVGRQALRAFFAELQKLDRTVKLDMLRVAGLEAAFVFTITFAVGDSQMRLQPVDTAVFDAQGKIASLRSYFTASDVTAV